MRSEWSRRTIQCLHCQIDTDYNEDSNNQIIECLQNKPKYSLVFYKKFPIFDWQDIEFIDSPKIYIKVIGTSMKGVAVADPSLDINYLCLFIPESKFLDVKVEGIEIEDIPPDEPRQKMISPEKLIEKLMSDDRHYCFIIFQIYFDEYEAMNNSDADYEFQREVIMYTSKILDLLKKRYCSFQSYQFV